MPVHVWVYGDALAREQDALGASRKHFTRSNIGDGSSKTVRKRPCISNVRCDRELQYFQHDDHGNDDDDEDVNGDDDDDVDDDDTDGIHYENNEADGDDDMDDESSSSSWSPLSFVLDVLYVWLYLFLLNIISDNYRCISDRYRCIWVVPFSNDFADACVIESYAQRSLSLHAGVGAAISISDDYRCFHVKIARTAIAIAAIVRLRLSAMAMAACMVILRAICCLEFFGPRTRNIFVLTTGGWFLVVSWRMVQRSGRRF
jgi:hypothetical protein